MLARSMVNESGEDQNRSCSQQAGIGCPNSRLSSLDLPAGISIRGYHLNTPPLRTLAPPGFLKALNAKRQMTQRPPKLRHEALMNVGAPDHGQAHARPNSDVLARS